MKKCAICEKIYDEAIQQVYIKDLDTGKISEIRNISKGDKLWQLCPKCMRMVIFTGMAFKDNFGFELANDSEIIEENVSYLPVIKW